MKSVTIKILGLALLSLFVAASASAKKKASGPEITEDGVFMSESTVSSEASDEQLQKAIIQSAINRRWQIIEKTDGKIHIQIAKTGYEANLTIRYGASKLKFYSDSWTTHKKTGDRLKRKDPAGWVENLKRDIGAEVSRLLYL